MHLFKMRSMPMVRRVRERPLHPADNKLSQKVSHCPARLLIVPLITLLIGACSGAPADVAVQVIGGDASRAPELIRQYGCGSCHVVPGVRSARGLVGPPLEDLRQRVYIAGTLPNTPDNLIHWIRAPQAIRPGTAMPNMNVTDEDARHLAAYLYTR